MGCKENKKENNVFIKKKNIHFDSKKSKLTQSEVASGLSNLGLKTPLNKMSLVY